MNLASQSISKIYSNHFDALKADLIYWSGKDEMYIEDILQDAFIKLQLSISQGKMVNNPRAWLYRASKNLLIDKHRKKNSSEGIAVPLDENMEGVGLNASESKHKPEDCLLGIISNLPYKYKKAVYLTDVKGVPQTESAKMLGLTLPTFKSHVQRGRKLVTQGYVDCCDYSLDQNGKLRGETKDWEECKVCSVG